MISLYIDSDVLVDLWYLKHLSDQFSTKVHVSEEFYEFVAQYVAPFTECFTCFNQGGEVARIHYDCCDDPGSCVSVPKGWGFKVSPFVWGSKYKLLKSVVIFISN